MTIGSRAAALGTLALAAQLSAPRAQAVETRFWHVDSRGGFEEGDADGVSIDADGVITLAPSRSVVAESDEVYFWDAAVLDDDALIAGTGDNGRVLEVRDGTTELLADLEILEVMALAVATDGTIYAGGAPGGKVYAIRHGEATELFDTEQGVIWDILVEDGGDLLVATGDEGRLFRVSRSGEGTLLYSGTDAHVMCITPAGDGDVIIGTAGDGLVLRVSRDGDVAVLYDAEEEEIRSVVRSSDGSLYVAVNSAPEGESNGDKPRPAVYRVGEYGQAQRLWRGDHDFIFDLIERDGALVAATGGPATLYRIEPATRRSMRLIELEESSILHVLPRDGALILATGDPARLYELPGGLRERGTLESVVQDAGAEAEWSRVRWIGAEPGGTGIGFETRTGNRKEPDLTWSEWRAGRRDEDDSFAIDSPAARFFQWRLVLDGGPRTSPSVSAVTTSYREINLPPQLVALDVSRKGSDLFPGPDARPRSVRRRLPSGIEVDYTLPFESGGGEVSPGDAQWAVGLRTVSWVATDPNGDELTFDLYYRPVESDRWQLLVEDLEDLVYTWDTSVFPDGEYRIKVVATDERGNPDGALSDERLSGRFDIDNTPPRVSRMHATLDGSIIRIQARAEDERSAIIRADVTLDGQEWRPARPSTGFLDARKVELDLELDAGDLGSGDPVVLRFFDEAGNRIVSRAFVE